MNKKDIEMFLDRLKRADIILIDSVRLGDVSLSNIEVNEEYIIDCMNVKE